MKKIFLILIAVLALFLSTGNAVFANGQPAFGQNVDLTGVEYVRIVQAEITLEPNNPGIPAFVKKIGPDGTCEVSGYLWDLKYKPVIGMPPVFSYVYIGDGQTLRIAKVMPIFNYGIGTGDIGYAAIKQADISMDPSPSNVGIPANVKGAMASDGTIVSGYVWDLNQKPVLEIPPVGALIWVQDRLIKVVR